jgi:error-prone DNA polymerase
MVTGLDAPPLPELTPPEQLGFDLVATGLSPDRHPTELVRHTLTEQGVLVVAELVTRAHGTRVTIAGLVTHRQQPRTARGVVFLNLEDETGLANVICTPEVWRRHHEVARRSPALLIRGVLEHHQGVVNVLARRITPLVLATATPRSRDFR